MMNTDEARLYPSRKRTISNAGTKGLVRLASPETNPSASPACTINAAK